MGITDFGFLFHKVECPQAPKLPSSFSRKRVEKRPATGRALGFPYCASLMAACAERYSGRTFWTTAPYPSNCMAYDPTDNFPPFMSFTIKFDEAEAYRKAIGCYLRKNQWEDITVDVYL